MQRMSNEWYLHSYLILYKSHLTSSERSSRSSSYKHILFLRKLSQIYCYIKKMQYQVIFMYPTQNKQIYKTNIIDLKREIETQYEQETSTLYFQQWIRRHWIKLYLRSNGPNKQLQNILSNSLIVHILLKHVWTILQERTCASSQNLSMNSRKLNSYQACFITIII